MPKFTKKDQQMHLKSILKTHTKTLKSPYMKYFTDNLNINNQQGTMYAPWRWS
jgi:hypothetical protein